MWRSLSSPLTDVDNTHTGTALTTLYTSTLYLGEGWRRSQGEAASPYFV